jgi:hypothetical protein
MSLVVACVLVQGHVGFTPDYVFKLKSMVARHLSRPHRFVCLTDHPESLLGVETIAIPTPRGHFAWWSKLELFNPKHEALRSGRILYLDLDVLVIDALEPIVDYACGISFVPDDAPNFKGKGEMKVVKRFNSSVMCWEADASLDRIYQDWTPDVAKRLWGDQDWLGEQLPNASKMPLHWFPRLSQVTTKGKVDSAIKNGKVILCKKPKNAEAARQWPWFAKAWR